MKNQRITAIIVGFLYIIGTVAGILSVVFTGPVRNASDYFLNLPADQSQLILGALFVLIMGLVLAMMPVMMYPLLRKQQPILALGYVLFRGALETGTYFLTVISWLYLLPLSPVYLQAGASQASQFQALGDALLEGEATSFLTTIVFILGALMFYYALYRSKLVPRWISAWGLLSTIPYIVAGFLVIFKVVGHMSTFDTILRLPLALQEMVLAVWLIAKGFNHNSQEQLT